MSESQVRTETGEDTFQTAVAVLIALVTLMGALVAWRASLQSGVATKANAAGLSAILNSEATQTLNNTALHQHYRAYMGFVRNNVLEGALVEQTSGDEKLAPVTLRSVQGEAGELAATHQLFFPNRYLGRNNSYDVRRELGEAWAQAGEQLDLEPAEDFAQATLAASRSTILISMLVVLAVALFCYTLAQRLHPIHKELRYGFAIVASLCFFVAVVTSALVEYVSQVN